MRLFLVTRTEKGKKKRQTTRLSCLSTPDFGGSERFAAVAHKLGISLISGEKSRSAHDDKTVLHRFGDATQPFAGKTVILADDESATMGTLMQAVKAVKEGGATHIIAAIVHNNLPTDPAKRAELLRHLREAGAERIHFLDTQASGVLPEDLEGFLRTVPSAKAITTVLSTRAEAP